MEMNFLISAYCFALMGCGFSLMSSGDGQYNSITPADDGSLVSRHTDYIMASIYGF